ncbi:hypothetical protein BLOT_004730 [Blomia tropicalis]|nr:hypothetical protein BLOT_004730 [Blomia tropicalis]
MSIVNSPTPTTGSGRGSYPSRQKRFGPAPLASFEDLPTDDQQSSSEDERRETISPSKICPPISVVITEYNGPEQYDMYNGSPNVTPTNCTVTVDHTEKVSTKNVDIGFANNTIAPKVTEKRKGSWTDLFSIRKSPTPPKERERKFSLFNFKFFSKDNRTSSESQLKDISNINSTERKQSKIVVQDKCETTPQTIDVDDGRQSSCTLGDESVSSYCSDITPTNMETKSFISVTETVVEIERPYSANDVINVVNQITNDSDSPSLCSLNDQDQTDCCYETETDCAECKATETIKITCECVDTDCCNGSAEDNEDESVEHVLASEDCELEYLLTGDELEHNLNANLDISSYKPNQTISNVTNKINLKVSMPEILKTLSIERPHSITPVNIDSFEAYLNQSLTPESKPNYDRLTITIPGLPSPSQHNRFARKSNPFIWAKFCERGLKSPQIIRKRANSCFPEINCQHSYVNDAFELSVGSPENLTPITPIKDMDDGEDRFDDNFWDYLNRVNRPNVTKSTESDSVADDVPIRVALKNLRRLQTSCSCDCNTTSVGSANAYHGVSITSCSEMNSFSESDNNEPSMSSAMNHQPFQSKLNEDEPLVSPCDCTCHGRRPEAIPFSLTDISTSIESTHSCLCNQSGELLYDGRTTEDDDLSQLSSSSTLSSSSSTPSSTSQSVRLLDTSATSKV